jgi:uncharacterized protein (DUF58 family)
MTRLGAALALGSVVTLAAVAFGSRPLGVAGVGLLLAGGWARLWAALVRGPVAVAQLPEPAPATEGDRVRLRVEALRRSRVPAASWAIQGQLGRLGEYECRLHGYGRRGTGEVDLGRLPRGRYAASDVRVVLGDLLGFETVTLPPATAPAAVLVHPRLVELEGLFSDAGRAGAGGRRLLLRRPAGFDFHSVRAYEPGESLRRVHWPTTARRGELMVKELEDNPRDSAVVVLDCDPGGAAGEPPEASFDAAARAAGSLVRAYARRGRTAVLVTTGQEASTVRVSGAGPELQAALGALAAAEPDARLPLSDWLRRARGELGEAGELVVVTGVLGTAAAQALVAEATRRLVSVVYVDAPSYAGRPTQAAPGPLRLAASGIPVAVVRRGDDLASALGPPLRQVGARA